MKNMMEVKVEIWIKNVRLPLEGKPVVARMASAKLMKAAGKKMTPVH